MGLFDKIKDLFMDEVMDDDEIELEEEEKKEYKEPKKDELPKVMRETIKKEEKKDDKIELKVKPQEFVFDEKKEVRGEQPRKFNFPIDLDNDYKTEELRSKKKIDEVPSRSIKRDNVINEISSTRNNNVNVLNLEKEASRKVAELYSKKSEDKNIKPKFKASPVISPVYGVLDKNYTKEEVIERTEDNSTMKRPSKKVDFETVRKKAFGNLADEIKDNLLCENCELYKEVKKISALKEDDLLYDMTVDPEEEKGVTIEKAYDNYEEFGVAYEPKVEKKKEINEEEEIDITNEVNIINNINDMDTVKDDYTVMENKIDDGYEDNVSEVIENSAVTKVDEEEIEIPKKDDLVVPSRSEKKKEEKVDADFFELIDSMYKERIDE